MNRSFSLHPLSFAQQRLWFIEKISSNKPIYNISIAITLEGALNTGALKKAYIHVIESNEMLRSQIREVDGIAYQILRPAQEFTLKFIKFRNENALQRFLKNEAKKTFTLTKGQLIRGILLKINSEKHLLLLTMHHIISDEWSIDLLFHELSDSYNKIINNVKLTSNYKPYRYLDFAKWQKEFLQSEEILDQLNYWTTYLKDAPESSGIPIDHQRPDEMSYKGAIFKHQLPAELQNKLNNMARVNGCTLFITLMTAFQILLYRYSGKNDVVIGTPISNRHYSEVETLMGFFVNSMPIRAQFEQNETFVSALKKTRNAILECYENQDIPFDKIVDGMKIKRDLSKHPIFQTMFFVDVPQDYSCLFNYLHCHYQFIDNETSKFDLLVSAKQEENGLSFRFEYATDLYDPTTIERLAKNFEVLLNSITQTPQAKIVNLLLITQEEREYILSQSTKSMKEAQSEDMLIHELFEKQVNLNPNEIAVIFSDNCITYQQLNNKINQYANCLLENNITKGDVIAVCLNRSPKVIYCLFALFKIGACYLPIDIKTPIKRLNAILDDANAIKIITDKTFDTIEGTDMLPIQKLDLFENYENPMVDVSEYDLAYVIYTSGSTGKPKGVIISHQAIANSFLATHEFIGNTPMDKFLAVTPHSFDVSLHDYLLPLCTGGQVLIAEDIFQRDPKELIRLIKDHHITIMQATPSTWQMIVESGCQLAYKIKALSAGEALHPTLAHELLVFAKVYNLYGPTEATIYTTGEVVKFTDSPSIGRPLLNYQTFILDENKAIVPIGVSGELYIAGPNLSLGYLNSPELTAKVFIPNPFDKSPGSRMYKTGDKVRYLSDGRIQYLGRIDNQVKIRGNRVELEEIENILSQHQLCQNCVVIPRDDLSDHTVLVAYYITKETKIDVNRELRQYLEKFLPDYMIPSDFVSLKEFPMTQNQKIDRKALPKPNRIQAEMAVVPRNRVEQEIADIWYHLLNVQNLGIDDNFFQIGGDSIISIQFISLSRQKGYHFTPKQVFFAPTIRQLAKLAMASQASGCNKVSFNPENSNHSLVQRARWLDGATELYPLSPIQQGLHFHSLYNPESEAYVLLSMFRIRGKINEETLKKSWQYAIDQFDALRTGVVWEGLEEPMQYVQKDVQVPWTSLNYSQCSQEEFDQKIMQLVAEQHRIGFDLTKAPLMRLNYIKSPSDSVYLIWTYHHIILDGWCGPLILSTVKHAYRALIANQILETELRPQYKSYINWLQDNDLERTKFFWREYLSGTQIPSRLNFPQKTTDSLAKNNSNYESLFSKLSVSDTQRLRAFAKKYQVTLSTVIQLAWAIVLQRFIQQDDFVFGVVFSGRSIDIENIDSIVGVFINTLPFRITVKKHASIEGLLKYLQSTMIDIQEHSYVSLAQVKDWCAEDKQKEVFDSIFVFENYPDENNTHQDEYEITLEKFIDRNEFPLCLAVHPGKELEFYFSYQCHRYDPEMISRLNKKLLHVLQNITEESHKIVSDIKFFDRQDFIEILEQQNQTKYYIWHQKGVHELFEAQVNKIPDATAVVSGSQRLTYQQLNKKANQLARHLRTFGLSTDKIVGICLDRSEDYIISLLAILKAGAAYLALDGSHPIERNKYMLNDAKVSILITNNCYEQDYIEFECINLSSAEEVLHKLEDTNLNLYYQLNHLVYVIYTSGSTGKPKGVLIEHKSLTNFISNFHSLKDSAENWRSTFWTAVGFDVSAYEIWGALTAGEELHILSDNVRMHDISFYEYLSKHQIHNAYIPPLFLRGFAKWLEANSLKSSLRHLLIGVEPITIKLIKNIKDYLPALKIINGYGPTETTICCSYFELSEENPIDYTTIVPIGRPTWNTKIYILDKYLELVPLGVEGELYVGGEALARGYLNQESLVTEKFIPDPFSANTEARLYRTGDKARYLPDGNIEFIGRIDDQVKVRGYRIECGEIENHLRLQPKIMDALVIVNDQITEHSVLVAYLIGDETALSVSDIRQHLTKFLPDYMIPSHYVWIERFPMTVNGKLDKKALPLPGDIIARNALDVKKTTQCTTKERILIDVFSCVLNNTEVGVEDNFFELGGDSILAIQVLIKCREKGLNIEVKDIFEYPTIKDLAIQATEERVSDFIEKAEEIITEQPFEPIPIQEWFFEQGFKNQNRFNQSFLFDVNGYLKPNIVEQTFEKIKSHHHVLSSIFQQKDGKWKQRYELKFKRKACVTFIDLRSHNSQEQDQIMQEKINQLQSSLNIESGDLLKVALFDLSSTEQKLFIVIHHLVIDGVSWRLLVNNFCTIYKCLNNQQPIVIPQATHTFSFWSDKIHQYADSTELLNELSYWRNVANQTTESSLPVDYQQGKNTINTAQLVTSTLDKEKTSALLKEIPKVFDTSINDILLTALAISILQWTKKTSILINLEGHGREMIDANVDLSNTLGWFTSLFPVNLSLSNVSNIQSSIKEIKKNLDSLPNKGIGFGILKYIKNIHELRNINPEICFNYLGQWDNQINKESIITFSKKQMGGNHDPLNHLLYKIDINCLVKNGRLQVEWFYSEKQYSKNTMDDLLRNYMDCLKAIIEHCLQKTNNSKEHYDLSPSQLGLLFNHIYSLNDNVRNNNDTYHVQSLLHSTSFVDEKILRASWVHAVDQFDSLRTAFNWDNLEAPKQIVMSNLELPWLSLDWTNMSNHEIKIQLGYLKSQDREKAFDLSQAPLLRFYFIRVSEQESYLLWSHHHIIMDGWCMPLLMHTVKVAYDALISGYAIPSNQNTPYKYYIDWLALQNKNEAEGFWRNYLRGIEQPTKIQLPRQQYAGIECFGVINQSLTRKETKQLQQYARANKVTVNTVFQLAWSIILSKYIQRTDFVYGIVVSGRGINLNGVDGIVGLFINTLPLRIEIKNDQSVEALMQTIQRDMVRIQRYGYLSLAEIQALSGCQSSTPFFDNLISFANYPHKLETAHKTMNGYNYEVVELIEKTEYPLCIAVIPKEEFTLRFTFDHSYFSEEQSKQLINHLCTFIRNMI